MITKLNVKRARAGAFKFAGVLLVAMASGTLNAAPGHPNFLMILSDDQGWSQVSEPMDPGIPESCSTYLHTPNMNRLANGGMRFTNGYAPGSVCTPTRRAILCGTSTARSGGSFPSKWDPGQKMTIPKALKQADPSYRCAHFGKWGEKITSSPEQCGYDVSDGKTGNINGQTVGELKDGKKGNECYVAEDPKLTRTVTERAIGFMREQHAAGKPFYVQVSYYAVHLQVELLQETLDKYREKGDPDRKYSAEWAGMLEDLDNGVGQLLAALDELDIADNTYVVYMSDNGGRGGVPGRCGPKTIPTNHPLSGAKSSIYEGGHRVPFFMRGPGIPAGSYCHVPVAGYDLLPTFYSLAGGTAPLPDYLDGGNLKSLFVNPEKGAVERVVDALVFHWPNGKQAAIRQGDYKLIVEYDSKTGEIVSRQLFNLSSDIGETRNLIGAEMDRYADRLEQMLVNYWKGLDPKILKMQQLPQ